MTVCDLCKGKGWVQGQAPGIPTACSACGGKGFVEQTNEEWLKSTKDTNQFACEMCELFEILCTDCKFYDKSMRIGGCTLPSWLKEVHKE